MSWIFFTTQTFYELNICDNLNILWLEYLWQPKIKFSVFGVNEIAYECLWLWVMSCKWFKNISLGLRLFISGVFSISSSLWFFNFLNSRSSPLRTTILPSTNSPLGLCKELRGWHTRLDFSLVEFKLKRMLKIQEY